MTVMTAATMMRAPMTSSAGGIRCSCMAIGSGAGGRVFTVDSSLRGGPALPAASLMGQGSLFGRSGSPSPPSAGAVRSVVVTPGDGGRLARPSRPPARPPPQGTPRPRPS
jgi:hypothetical protein